jgi:hypothetical protein
VTSITFDLPEFMSGGAGAGEVRSTPLFARVGVAPPKWNLRQAHCRLRRCEARRRAARAGIDPDRDGGPGQLAMSAPWMLRRWELVVASRSASSPKGTGAKGGVGWAESA